MDFEQARFNMIEQQIRPWEVLDPDILRLLALSKREEFVPEAHKNLAFADLCIPLGEQQSMLEPKLEARLLQAASVKNSDNVLEIGTGSGYMAALLATQAAYVDTIEISPALAERAKQNLQRAGVANVTVHIADGLLGCPEQAPYDVIMLSGSLPTIPDSLLKQLKIGGRLVAVVGQSPVMTAQLIVRVEEDAFNKIKLFETQVPVLSNAVQPARFVF
ncbi:MAG: protein-L-isoaspartate O-methyltransferase [Pseudomonadota bacterium]